MTARLSTLLLFISLCTASTAQVTAEDSEKIEATRKNADSNFVKLLLVVAQKTASIDSQQRYLSEAIEVSQKLDYTAGLLEARDDLAMSFYLTGRLSQALKILLINHSFAVQKGDSIAVFKGLRNTATIYIKIGNINLARADLNRRQYMLDHKSFAGITDTSYYVLSQYNSLAQLYGLPQVNKPDSADYYFNQLYRLGKNTSFKNLWTQLGANGLARGFARKQLYDSALFYSDIALAAAISGNRADNYYSMLLVKAETFRSAGNIDSAFNAAYKVYNGANTYSYAALLVTSSGMLAKLFVAQQRYDSAVKYLAIESRYKDSVSGQEAIKNIQALTNEEQLKTIERQREQEDAIREYKSTVKNYLFVGGILLLLIIIAYLVRNGRQRNRAKKEMEAAYTNLKNTQAQLIQSEKMASLGELTAGIAHEIQNPLNFVNNFSEINNELLQEVDHEIQSGNLEEVKSILLDVKDNSIKINHHGKRADGIVKGMMQHSRSGKGQKELTDINQLVDEYLRLAYHGLRAKDKFFNATLHTDLDASIGMVAIIPQDFGRAILNLVMNAFYAVDKKKKASSTNELYEPEVAIATKKQSNNIIITVSDNGGGIPSNITDKIFQPFFTTKPTGEGTGLGLSLTYDIIKTHGGEIKVETTEGDGSVFTISLPANA